jgi:hypothetical protein
VTTGLCCRPSTTVPVPVAVSAYSIGVSEIRDPSPKPGRLTSIALVGRQKKIRLASYQ